MPIRGSNPGGAAELRKRRSRGGGATCRVSSLAKREHGQLWMSMLLVLLVALNDPMYIARVIVGGNQALYAASVLGQIGLSQP